MASVRKRRTPSGLVYQVRIRVRGYGRYGHWCKGNGYKPMSMNQFKDAFERTTGLEQGRNAQGRYWPNITLRK